MNWNTKITKLLHINYPIIQGAMAYISDGTLAAAMYHAGCCGVIGSGGFSVDEVRAEIRKVKDILGPDKVYGVNLMLQAPNKDDIAQLVCDEKVPFVTLGAGNPIPWFEPLHKNGIKCIPVVPNVRLAQKVQEAGADALVVEGMEAGGHDGKITLMALLENVLPEIEIPVVAAGGIVDGYCRCSRHGRFRRTNGYPFPSGRRMPASPQRKRSPDARTGYRLRCYRFYQE